MNSNLIAGFLDKVTSKRFLYLVHSLRLNIFLRHVSYYRAAGKRAKVATNLTQFKYD